MISLKLKSTIKVKIDPIVPFIKDPSTGLMEPNEEFVFMSFPKVTYEGDKYIVPVLYYYEYERATGKFDAMNQPITIPTPKPLPSKPPTVFLRAEAQALEASIVTGLSGSTFSDKFDSLILAGVMYKLSTTTEPPFGLTVTDWSIVPV